MALFDNLGAKMSQMGQKTKDFTEINRIKGLISDEEKNISRLTAKIGETYLALHQNDPEEGLAELVGTVAAAKDKIGEYQKQIQALRGVKQCPYCGADMEPGAQFCGSCGRAMAHETAAAPANTVTCPSCGAQVAEGAKFCKVCGNPMTPPPAPESFVCPNCGAAYTEKPAFCAKCGQKL